MLVESAHSPHSLPSTWGSEPRQSTPRAVLAQGGRHQGCPSSHRSHPGHQKLWSLLALCGSDCLGLARGLLLELASWLSGSSVGREQQAGLALSGHSSSVCTQDQAVGRSQLGSVLHPALKKCTGESHPQSPRTPCQSSLHPPVVGAASRVAPSFCCEPGGWEFQGCTPNVLLFWEPPL